MMHRAAVLVFALLLAPVCAPVYSWATVPCPVPDNLALHDLVLPATRQAVATGALTILVLGGAPMAGKAAADPAATFPARLEAGLGAALPNVHVRVVNAAIARSTAEATVPGIPALIRDTSARLVIWATGAREAALGTDTDQFTQSLQAGIAAVQKAQADLILVDMQYAPSIARVTNNAPFRAALIETAATHDVPVLQRHDLMMFWNDQGLLNLDALEPQARIEVARRLFSCLATALVPPIVVATR